MGVLDKYLPKNKKKTGVLDKYLPKKPPTPSAEPTRTPPSKPTLTSPQASPEYFASPSFQTKPQTGKEFDLPAPTGDRQTFIGSPTKEPAPEMIASQIREYHDNQRLISDNRKNATDRYSGSNLGLDAFAQGILPLRPNEMMPPALEQSFPVRAFLGKLTGLGIMSGLTAGIAPAVEAKLIQKTIGKAIAEGVSIIPGAKQAAVGIGLKMNISPFSYYLTRAIPRMIQRASLWGGKELVDQLAMVAGGGDELAPGKIAKETATEGAFGAVSGMASGVGGTVPRIATQGAVRGIWTAGQELLEDGSIDKNDMINIALNATLGAAVEAINAKTVSRAYKAKDQSIWNRNWAENRIRTRHPEYTSEQVKKASDMIEEWSWKLKRPAQIKVYKELAQKERALNSLGLSTKNFSNAQKAQVVESITNKLNNSLIKAPDGISSGIAKTFEVPGADPALTTRPAIRVERTSIAPDGEGGFKTVDTVDDEPVAASVGEEAAIQELAQGEFDALGVPDTSWGVLPRSHQKAVARYVKENGKEGLENYVKEMLAENVSSSIGNVGKSPGRDTPIFYGPRVGFGKNPSANIQVVVSDMLQADTPVGSMEVFGLNEGDAARVADAILREYQTQQHNLPDQPDEPTDDIAPFDPSDIDLTSIVQPEAPTKPSEPTPVEPEIPITPENVLQQEFGIEPEQEIVEVNAENEDPLLAFFKVRSRDKKAEEDARGLSRYQKKLFKKSPKEIKVEGEPTFKERVAARSVPDFSFAEPEDLPAKSGITSGLPTKPKGTVREEGEAAYDEDERDLRILESQKITSEYITDASLPQALRNVPTNDLSQRQIEDIIEYQRKGELVEEGADVQKGKLDEEELTEEEAGERERWNEGIREQSEVEALARDTSDYLTSSNQMVVDLTNHLHTLQKSINFFSSAHQRAEQKVRIAYVEKQIQEIVDWHNRLKIDNDIYSISEGELHLKKEWLTLKSNVRVRDAEKGITVDLHGQGQDLGDDRVSTGEFRLIDLGDGKIQVTDSGEGAVVYPTQLLNIMAAGNFTDKPSENAKGMNSSAYYPFGGSSTSNYKAFDGKKVVIKTLPGFKEDKLRLKVLLKSMRLFGVSNDRMKVWLGAWTKKNQVIKQDKDLPFKINQEILKEKHYNVYSQMNGDKLEDSIRQTVRDYVEKQFKLAKLPNPEQVVVKAINDSLYHMQLANAEIISLNYPLFARSDQGLSQGFQPGQITGHPDSEKLAVIEDYKIVTGQLPMPDGEISSMPINPNPQHLQMMEQQNIRPELLFWDLLPPELQKLVLYVKSEYENPHFQDMRDSGVMDRADVNSLILRGYSNRHFTFDDEQERENYYGGKTYLSSTDVPHAKYRTYSEFRMATGMGSLGAGMHPVVDFAATSGEYVRDAINRTGQMNMIAEMKSIPNSNMSRDGQEPLHVITNLAEAAEYMKLDPSDDRVSKFLTKNAYSEIKLPALIEYFRGGFKRAWVRNDLHELIKFSYMPTNVPGWWKNFTKLSGTVKRMVLFSPQQYKLQIGSSPAMWLGWGNAWKLYIKPAVTGEFLWAPTLNRVKHMKDAHKAGHGWRYGMTQHLSEWNHIDSQLGYDPDLLDAFLRAGLNGLNISGAMQSLYAHDELKGHPDKRSEWEDIWTFLAGKGGMDRHVFNQEMGRLMYNFTDTLYQKFKKEGIPHDRAVATAVDFANTTSGLLDSANWTGTAGPFFQGVLFARDFTFSFMKQVTLATYPAWKPFQEYRPGTFGLMNQLMHTNKDTKEMETLWKYAVAHVTKVLLGKMVVNALLGYAIVKAFQHYYKGQITPEKQEEINRHLTTQGFIDTWNDSGKFGMIWTPFETIDNRDIYIDPLMFREINQFVGVLPIAGGNVGQFISGKLSWGIQAAVMLKTLQDYKGDPITDKSGTMPWYLRMRDILVALGQTTLPTFIRESPRVSPALQGLTYAIGFPLKKSRFKVGEGESLEEAKDLRAKINAIRYLKGRERTSAAKAFSVDQLEAMVELWFDSGGTQGISPDTFDELLNQFDAPVQTLQERNERALDLYGFEAEEGNLPPWVQRLFNQE